MRRRPQFSVEWFLALTIVLAIAVLALISQPPWISILVLRLTLIAAMGLVAVMAIQGGQLVRSFGIGAAFPAAVGAVLAVAPLFSLPEEATPIADQTTQIVREPQLLRTFGELPEADLRFRAGFLLGATLLSGVFGLGLAWLVLDSAEPSDALSEVPGAGHRRKL